MQVDSAQPADNGVGGVDAGVGVGRSVRVLLAATVTGGTGGASSSGAAGSAGNAGIAGIAGTAGSAGCRSVYCGDGCRDTTKEECDEGVGSPGKFCSWACQTQENWASHSEVTVPPGSRVTRRLGRGRHPLAANENRWAIGLTEQITPAEQQIRVAIHSDSGTPVTDAVVSTGTWVADRADPVVAVLGNGDVVTAYTEFGGDGDGLGVALRRLRAGQTTPDSVTWASSPSFASQYDADILALFDRILVAYTDEYDAVSGPDITLREFGLDLKPIGNARALGATGDVEGRVALAKLGSSWGAAWRRSAADGSEAIDVYDAATGTQWSVGPHMPADGDDTPALVALDSTRRLLLYVRDAAPSASNQIAMTGQLYFAVLSTAQPGTPISNAPVALTSSPYTNYVNLASRRPSLVNAGSDVFIAWSTAQRTADPSFANGEEVWFERVTPTLNGTGATFAYAGESPLPRWSAGRLGDQRVPAITLLGPGTNQPGGALVSAWEDFGETLGTGSGEPEIVAQMTPLSLRRDATTPATDCSTTALCAAGKGKCTANSQCQSGLICGFVPGGISNGPSFGYGTDVGVCVASHCADHTKNSTETGVDCGGADCGVCLCGDGVTSTELGEVCDSGGTNTAACDSDCTAPVCGDGLVNSAAGEECDLGTAGNNGQTCTAACKAVVQTGPLQVLAQRGTYASNALPLTIRISNPNTTTNSLSGVTLRYWYMVEGTSPLTFACTSFGSVGCAAVSTSVATISPTLAGANRVMTITINSTASLAANGGAIDLIGSLLMQPAAAFDPTNDYSYPTQSMNLWDRIALYRGANLVYGVLPTLCGNGTVDTGEACDKAMVASCNSTCSAYTAPGNKTACTVETGCLSATHYRVDSSTDNKIEPYIMLTNKTGIAIAMNRITVKYWYSKDGTTGFTQTPSCTSAKMTPAGSSVCGSGVTVTSTALSPVSNSMDSIVTMAFAGRSETLAVNQTTGWLVPRITRSTGTFSESGDWSRTASVASPGTLAPKIGIYVDNILWWGQEP
jgi:hypothetical protein